MEDHFKGRSAASIKYDEAKAWIDGLVNPKRSRHTVYNTWLNASATVFGWAVEHQLIPKNPFADIPFTVPKKVRLRDTQAFHEDEQRIILEAALEITDTTKHDDAAKRWVPWLCAYTGARVGEIAQLRKEDVIERDGIPAIRITPEAGTVKGRNARTVPLHPHLIAQGFLKFVEAHADGPLFYRPRKNRGNGAKDDRRKPPYAQVRQRLAAWVRELGIADKELQPNHAWRHTFKQIADHAEISERMSIHHGTRASERRREVWTTNAATNGGGDEGVSAIQGGETAMKPGLRLKRSEVTEAYLLKIEKIKKRRADRPKTLPLKDIQIADRVFQWRNLDENIMASVNHLKDLVRVLEATNKPLDPIVVTPIGSKFYLLEGHHRLQAYREARWRKPIPVRYFEGSVKEAQDKALVLNFKDKLRMTRAEKFDAAFRLVKQGEKTYEQIKDITTVSVRGEDTRNRLDWLEEKAQKLAGQIVKNVGQELVRDADITARALEIIDEDLPTALIYAWLDRAQEVLLDVVREQNNETAEQLLTAFIYAPPAPIKEQL